MNCAACGGRLESALDICFCQMARGRAGRPPPPLPVPSSVVQSSRRPAGDDRVEAERKSYLAQFPPRPRPVLVTAWS